MNTEAILGPGGSGKSYLLRKRIEQDPQYAVLTASTGIAAVNLGDGVTTMHSALGFYNTASLRESLKQGWIVSKICDLARKGKKNLVIDEISMVSAEQLELIHAAFVRAEQRILEKRNAFNQHVEPVGLILSGDYCQLAPVPDSPKDPIKFAFEAECWPQYAANLTKLDKIYRQDDPKFLEALTLARRGRGVDAAIALKQCGVEFSTHEDTQFDGITLFPVNTQVAGFNERRLTELPGDVIDIPSKRWGKERGEWKNIPENLQLKDGALVMILVNQGGEFKYVNGDLATFRVCKQSSSPSDSGDNNNNDDNDDIFKSGNAPSRYYVESQRGYTGAIPFAIRRNLSFSATDSLEDNFADSTTGQRLNEIEESEGRSKRWVAMYLNYMALHTMHGERYWEPRERGTVVGEVEYMPLRLAYASSYHKVQGLTLDQVQISLNHYWAGNPGMLYVALTRARKPEGLRIIGDVSMVAKRIKTDSRVLRWV